MRFLPRSGFPGPARLLVFSAIITALAATAAPGAELLITPPPRYFSWAGPVLALGARTTIVGGNDAEQQVGRVLREEMIRLHGTRLALARTAGSGPRIVLALTTSPAGAKLLESMTDRSRWGERKNEAYLLEVRDREAVLLSETPRGLLYAAQTLLQMVQPAASGGGKEIRGARIFDYPELAFRGIHICIFPNTELASVRQAMMLASRFRYNAVVLEPWAALKSKKRPETAYENAYTPEQIRPLVELGQALHMEMIPMLNSMGHASGMRSRSGEHVVLDRFPQFKPLYEEDGWSFCLTNPDIYDQLFARYEELLDLFDHPKYFHIGLDEGWGHRGLMEDPRCRGNDPPKTFANHLQKMHEFFAKRNTRLIVWHDMFIQRDHPQLGRLSPANSLPQFNSHLALPAISRDVIIAAWNYDQAREWPVAKYFHDKGYPVVVSPWKRKDNTIMLLDTAKNHKMLGLLATTWDSLDVSLPQVAEAGVLAWTAPGFDLRQVPFEHWLSELRRLPICELPPLENTLRPAAGRRGPRGGQP